MTDIETCRVTATRDGAFWLVEVPEIGQATQANAMGEIEDMARSLIAVSLDVAPASFEIDCYVRADPSSGAFPLRFTVMSRSRMSTWTRKRSTSVASA